jgi:Putative transposase
MVLEAHEFIRRFLLHVLPDGFMRIRHFGFLANRSKKHLLPQCRKLLDLSSFAPLPRRVGQGPAAENHRRRSYSLPVLP